MRDLVEVGVPSFLLVLLLTACLSELYLILECALSVADPNDTQNWQLMLAIKSNILRRMDSAVPGVRICCVKFVQQVILVQTPGMVADPRVIDIFQSHNVDTV
jgi:hypothetical protein